MVLMLIFNILIKNHILTFICQEGQGRQNINKYNLVFKNYYYFFFVGSSGAYL